MDKQRSETVARTLGLGLSVAVLAGVVAMGAYRARAARARRSRRLSRQHDYSTWKGAPEMPIDPPETSPYPAA